MRTAPLVATEDERVAEHVRGFGGDQEGTGITLNAELLPLVITNVHTDSGGDSKHVTTTIEGAQFSPSAIVKLVRPGIAIYGIAPAPGVGIERGLRPALKLSLLKRVPVQPAEQRHVLQLHLRGHGHGGLHGGLHRRLLLQVYVSRRRVRPQGGCRRG